MATGHAYDSEGGRAIAAAITSLMTGAAYKTSAELAGAVGPYDGYARNAKPHKRVIRKHADASENIRAVGAMDRELLDLASQTWQECIELGETNGYRNAQASLLAPTGTIGLMMDCDTTGIEPDLALVKFKKLVGGGSMQIVNQTVPRALKNLGYPHEQVEAITEYIAEHGHVVNAPGLRPEHYDVFDCAMGERAISPMGHVRMMAAVQPHLSGAISKTVNMPESATVEEIERIYFEGWKLGLKALAIYRDNCKVGQPLSDARKKPAEAEDPHEQVEAITEYIAEHGHVVNAPGLRPEHYDVFDCAMGERAISPMGHVRMMAAVQPHLSGAISKTVNMPESATVEEIERIYFEGWKLGLKALAIYRDNCKVGQPLSDARKKPAEAEPEAVPATQAAAAPPHDHRPVRRRLPRQRPATVTRFSVAGAEGYMTASSYPDDGIGEVFLKLGKQGSTLAGVMDAFSMAISVGLQYGIPLDSYVAKFTNMRFEPAGLTDDPDIRIASSVMDYIFRRLALDHLSYEDRAALGILSAAERAAEVAGHDPAGLSDDPDPVELAQSAAVEQPVSSERSVVQSPAPPPASPAAPSRSVPAAPHSSIELIEAQQGRTADAPLCLTCGTKMRPAGSCYVCEGCGSTSGCS